MNDFSVKTLSERIIRRRKTRRRRYQAARGRILKQKNLRRQSQTINHSRRTQRLLYPIRRRPRMRNHEKHEHKSKPRIRIHHHGRRIRRIPACPRKQLFHERKANGREESLTKTKWNFTSVIWIIHESISSIPQCGLILNPFSSATPHAVI